MKKLDYTVFTLAAIAFIVMCILPINSWWTLIPPGSALTYIIIVEEIKKNETSK